MLKKPSFGKYEATELDHLPQPNERWSENWNRHHRETWMMVQTHWLIALLRNLLSPICSCVFGTIRQFGKNLFFACVSKQNFWPSAADQRKQEIGEEKKEDR